MKTTPNRLTSIKIFWCEMLDKLDLKRNKIFRSPRRYLQILNARFVCFHNASVVTIQEVISIEEIKKKKN